MSWEQCVLPGESCLFSIDTIVLLMKYPNQLLSLDPVVPPVSIVVKTPHSVVITVLVIR